MTSPFTLLQITIAALCIALLPGCSNQSSLEKLYRNAVKDTVVRGVQAYHINGFKKEHTLAETPEQKLIFVSSMVSITPDKNMSKETVEYLNSMSQGFARDLVVLKKKKGHWTIPIGRPTIQTTAVQKTDYLIKLTIHKGYWEANVAKREKDRATTGRTSFSVADPKTVTKSYQGRSHETADAAAAGDTPACTNTGDLTYKPKVTVYQKQRAIVLPQASQLLLLIRSKNYIYGVDLISPREHATVMPGFISAIHFDARTTGLYNVYYYRSCGNDIEYGVLPLKIVPQAEFELLQKQS